MGCEYPADLVGLIIWRVSGSVTQKKLVGAVKVPFSYLGFRECVDWL